MGRRPQRPVAILPILQLDFNRARVTNLSFKQPEVLGEHLVAMLRFSVVSDKLTEPKLDSRS